MRGKSNFKIRKFIAIFLSIFWVGVASAQTPEYKRVAVVGFYNVENLFDTVNDPEINDDDFTPEGKNEWTEARYQEKLNNLATVITAMGEGPDILGLCEIENRKVIEDLVMTDALRPYGYQIIHYDSPDGRGIDVGLIYRPQVFIPFSTESIRVNAPEDFRTRDILLVKGLLNNDTLSLLINHWPSRFGGKEDKRIMAAKTVREVIDSLKALNSEAKIITMGDFNDNPNDKSIRDHLRATGNQNKLKSGELFNTSFAPYNKGWGSLAYQGAWNMFDQMILTQPLLQENSKSFFYMPDSFTVFAPKWMQTADGRFKGSPYRSYSFGKYIGGYSDHFPVFIVLVEE